MQNVGQETTSDSHKQRDKVASSTSSTPHDKTTSTTTTNSSPTKSETETFSELQPRFMTDSSESEEDSVSEVESFAIDQAELEEDQPLEGSKFLLAPEEPERSVDPETQARLEALLEAAGIGKLSSGDGKHLADHEVLRRLTSSVSCALDEAAAALTRMRSDNSRSQNEKRSLVEACTDGDVGTVRKLLTEGRSVHETTEEGESLLSLACSAGYYELAQVLLAMNANVEDRGIKGDCTPLMEAASAGHVDIVSLLIAHGADVNAQSTSGNTPLMYGCAGGHEEVVRVLLEAGANVEDHNENGHTPLMEAASAGHVPVAKILLEHGAGINTHSNEFKESALTLACYKGHLDMVRFLLDAGADQEHKTDEMHTALMEASMDGHVEVARLLLDSGAQVNMPTDSFESPLTLAACGGHVDLAMLLIERGANIEEVNDEGYTPLMEAAREGHEEMVALLLSQGANINAQTEETQETALTLACCGGFTEVADFLIKAGADIELGASTPLMEAAQEGHLDLVRYLLDASADVHAQTQTGDTALTYACENGHTDVAELLLQYGADLEHESEGGRTPLMKACRAGHLCTVQFLISKRADVNRQTTNNDHTPLSLACAGGHLPVVELLLTQSADPFHKLKDNSTMLIEAAKGGHTNVVQLLLDYPHSIIMTQTPHTAGPTPAPMILPQQQQPQTQHVPQQLQQPSQLSTSATPLQQQQQRPQQQQEKQQPTAEQMQQAQNSQPKHNTQKSLLRKNRSMSMMPDTSLTSAEAQQVRTQPAGEAAGTVKDDTNVLDKGSGGFAALSEPNISLSPAASSTAVVSTAASVVTTMSECRKNARQEQILHKQQILEELQRVERELQNKGAGAHLFLSPGATIEEISLSQFQQETADSETNLLPNVLNLPTQTSTSAHAGMVCGNALPESLFTHQTPSQAMSYYKGFCMGVNLIERNEKLKQQQQQQQQQRLLEDSLQESQHQLTSAVSASLPMIPSASIANSFGSADFITAALGSHMTNQLIGAATVAASTATPTSVGVTVATLASSTTSSQTITTSSDVSQNTAISDRAKLKPVHKKEKQQKKFLEKNRPNCDLQQIHHFSQKLQLELELDQIQQAQQTQNLLDPMDPELARLHRDGACPFFAAAQKAKHLGSDERMLKLEDGTQIPIDEAVDIFRSINFDDIPTEDTDKLDLKKLEICESVEQEQQQEQQQFDESQQQQTQQAVPVDTGPHSTSQEYYAIPVSSMSSVPNMPALSPLQVTNTVMQLHADISAALQLTPAQTRQRQMLNSYGEGLRDGLLAYCKLPIQNLPPVLDATGVTENLPQPTPEYMPSTTVCNGTAQVGQVQVATQTQVPTTQASASVAAAFAAGIAASVAINEKKQAYTTPVVKAKKTRYPLLQQQQPPQTQPTQTQPQPQPQPTQPQPQQTTQTCQPTMANIQQQTGNFPPQSYQLDPAVVVVNGQYTNNVAAGTNGQQPAATNAKIPPTCMDVDSETDSNHDTALTLACAGGHEELVELLLSRGADIEHRDKKGFTPLILAATAGHQKVVEILLNHGADIEAQSERTKDTPLSLACSGGRYEVVELLLNRGANKEHRNVSDYTPLSLAASGGYVNIIKLLLSHGAEINSRTGSKLGISPLMLAAMNGHTAAVKLLLDMGSDINAQIETNRNTALTLACFQGRHEVVSLLLDRKANVEHRAKTGLTPLMEAASGGYVEVGRVLLAKGADVNATPVPSSRDTALTIAADKGHGRFVELLLNKGAQVEVKNKKGNSPLWLAANGGHLNVVDVLYQSGADIDSQDNRKVSCLMAAFRKGHIKAVKWMVNHVTQFPSDQEMTRYVATVSDKELMDKCQECIKIIRAAKETQAAKANQNATILLEELDQEKEREESKKAAAARRRERKKKKKLEKKEEKRKLHEENKKNESACEAAEEEKKLDDAEDRVDRDDSDREATDTVERADSASSSVNRGPGDDPDKEEGDSGIDANSQGSCSSNDVKARERKKDKKKKKQTIVEKDVSPHRSPKNLNAHPIVERTPTKSQSSTSASSSTTEKRLAKDGEGKSSNRSNANANTNERKIKGQLVFESTRHPAEREDFEATGNESYTPGKGKKSAYNQYDDSVGGSVKMSTSTSPKQGGKREEGWKEVVRKGQSDDSNRFMNSPFRSKKVSVPPNAISRVIGRGGSNINAIRQHTGAHIEVEKQSKSQGERIITIKGSSDATKQAHNLIAALIKDPDVDILQMLPKSSKQNVAASSWDKTASTASTAKSKAGSGNKSSNLVSSASNTQSKSGYAAGTVSSTSQSVPVRSSSTVKVTGSFSASAPRSSAPPRLIASSAEKRAQSAQSSSSTKTTMSYTSAIMTAGRATKVVTTNATQTFAAKLSEIAASSSGSTHKLKSQSTNVTISTASPASTSVSSSAPSTPQASPQAQQIASAVSPKHCRTLPQMSAPSGHVKNNYASSTSSTVAPSETISLASSVASMRINSLASAQSGSMQQQIQQHHHAQQQPIQQQHHHHHQHFQQQHHHFAQQQQQQIRSTTPVSVQETQQVTNSTPLEYSLFNDTFSKVTQQSMWGRDDSQKGMNFASVAGGGVSISSASSSQKFIDSVPPQVDASKAPGYRGTTMCSPVSGKTCNTNSIASSGISPSAIPSPIQPPHHQSSINYSDHAISKPPCSLAVTRPIMPQQQQQQNVDLGMASQYSRTVYQSELSSRSGHQQLSSSSNSNLDAVGLFKSSQVSNCVMMTSRSGITTVATNNAGVNSSSSSSSNGVVSVSVSSSNASNVNNNASVQQSQQTNYDQVMNASLLKVVPNEVQSGQQQTLLAPFHPHQQQPSVNTTVSMSRLNPRAPDFSSSLHMSSKPQVTVFNAANSAIHPSMFAAPPSNNQIMQLGNYQLKQYQQAANAAAAIAAAAAVNSPPPQSRVAPQNSAMPSNGQQNRNTSYRRDILSKFGQALTDRRALSGWSFASGPPPHHNSFAPNPGPADPLLNQIGYNHNLANHLAVQASGNMDLMASLENGGSPSLNSSPSAAAQMSQEMMNAMKMDDHRKIPPRPIGTERAWKNYGGAGSSGSSGGAGGAVSNASAIQQNAPTVVPAPGVAADAADSSSINWIIGNDKLVGSWTGYAPAVDRHPIPPMPRSNPSTSYRRMPNVDTDIHQMIDNSFQSHLDNQQAFANGNAPAGLSMMPGLAMMPGQFSAPNLPEIPQNEPSKLEAPAWGIPDSVQDKQHPGWNKWTH